MTRSVTPMLIVSIALGAFGSQAAYCQTFGDNGDTSRAMWQGAYVGVHTGIGLGNAGSLSTGGSVLGLDGGYNFQAGHVVGGGEIDATSSQIKNDGTNESFNQKWMTSARARAGYAFGNLLTYGTFGLAVTATNYTNTYSTDATKAGWVYGAGVEAMIMPHIALRGELLRYDMGNSSYLNSSDQPLSLNTESNVFRIGIAYKF